MKPARIHLVHSNPTKKQPVTAGEVRRKTPCRLAEAHRPADTEGSDIKFSDTPLSDPAEILRRMPAQAIGPALLQLLDLMSSPILLIENSPTEELREIVPSELPRAA